MIYKNIIKNIKARKVIQLVLKMSNDNNNDDNIFVRNISFKEVFTTNKREYSINPYWTLEELYRNVGPQISADFGINENELDLVDTCNSYIILVGLPVETYPTLPKSSVTLVKDLWGIRMEYLAMYVRRSNNYLLREQGQCMVCLEDKLLEPYYVCGHKMCPHCYANCLLCNRKFCPMCRNQTSI
jgi:hypothetical protein